MIVVAAQLGEIEAHRQAAGADEPAQRAERARQLGELRQLLLGEIEHLGAAVQVRQREQRLAGFRIQLFRQAEQRGAVFFLQGFKKLRLELGAELRRAGDGAEHRHVADVDARVAHARELERLAQQPQDLQVGLDPRVAVELGAELDRLARRRGPCGTRMQHAAAVAQARHALAVEQMGVDARHLRRDVGAQAHHPARDLVHHLEGAKLEIVPGAGEQRIRVLDERRHHELVLPAEKQIQNRAAQHLDAHRFGGKDVVDVLGQDPAHHCSQVLA